MSRVPRVRVAASNDADVRANGEYVLYWMIAFRRTKWSFALERAVDWACELQRPLLVFEPLRVGYPWASDRLHRFVIDGMADNAARLAGLESRGVRYFPYVEPAPDAGKGLLEALAARACVVVTDDCPMFFLPGMVAAAAGRSPVRMERVDSNGLLPLRATDRVFAAAHSFRRFLQKELPARLDELPRRDPLARLTLPPMKPLRRDVVRRWRPAPPELLRGDPAELARLPLDHTVGVTPWRGGAEAARRRLREFLDHHITTYARLANDPDAGARSGLSPYLHFGHVSVHEAFTELMTRERWTPERLAKRPTGKREGWWGASDGAEAWLDELVTWRELAENMAAHREGSGRYESLPEWSRSTLEKHARDRREHLYTLDELTEARTHDELWNAAQTQLVREGHIHGYLRMLWGKKILEWTATPRDALDVMIGLNDRFALDGRDPSSVSGIFWVLGRYDRPWGPERPVFGTVRYMSSASTRRKLHVREYLKRYAPAR